LYKISEEDACQYSSASNGDVYLVGTKLFSVEKKFAFVANAGVGGTNAQKYCYGGNTLDWQARAFVRLRSAIRCALGLTS
jgi:hypothetical protein